MSARPGHLRPDAVPLGDGRVVRDIEERAHTAPLGVRCWDVVRDRQVTDGLVVRTTPVAGAPTVVASRTSTGTYGFVHLPTTRTSERRPVTDFPDGEPHVVEVLDRLGRFNTARVLVPAPSAFPLPEPIVLFSAPTRVPPPGFAAVRASLRFEDTSVPAATGRRIRPAAHAVLVVTVDETEHLGVADRQGEVLVLVPMDRFDAGLPPSLQERFATVDVRCDPDLAAREATPVIADIVAQPTRAHDEGPAFLPDHTVPLAFGADIPLTSPDRSELLLEAT